MLGRWYVCSMDRDSYRLCRFDGKLMLLAVHEVLVIEFGGRSAVRSWQMLWSVRLRRVDILEEPSPQSYITLSTITCNIDYIPSAIATRRDIVTIGVLVYR